MSKRPEKVLGTRLCLCLTQEGLTAYGNAEAFLVLGRYMQWLGASEPKDHYECHVTMSLESEKSMFEELRPRNVWALLAPQLVSNFEIKTDKNLGFELTFMMATTEDLDKMAAYQNKGVLPDAWNEETE